MLKNLAHAYGEHTRAQEYVDTYKYMYLLNNDSITKYFLQQGKKYIKTNTSLMSPLRNIYY